MHPHRVHYPPMSPPRFLHVAYGWHATNHPLRSTKRPLLLNYQPMYGLTWYVFPPFFFLLLADQPLPLCFIQLPPPSSTDTEAPLSSCHRWTPPMCECSVLDLIYTLQMATMRRLWYVPFFFFLSVFVVFSMSHCTLHIFRYYDE